MNKKRLIKMRALAFTLGLMCFIPMVALATSSEEEHAAELVQMAETRLSDGRTEAGLKICDMVLDKYAHTQAAAKAQELKRKATSSPAPVPASTPTTSITNTTSSGDEAHAAELLGMARTRLADGRTEAGLKICDMILSKYENTSSAAKAQALKSKYDGSSSTHASTTTTATSSGGSRTEEEHAAELVEMAETRLSDGRTEAAIKICDMVLEKYSHTRSAAKAREIKKMAEGN